MDWELASIQRFSIYTDECIQYLIDMKNALVRGDNDKFDRLVAEYNTHSALFKAREDSRL